MPPFHTRGVWSPHCHARATHAAPSSPCASQPGLVALSLASPCSPHCPRLWARDVTSSAPVPVVAQGGARSAAGLVWSRCWIPWLAPCRQDSHHLETCSIPSPSIPHLVPPSLAGLIPPWGLHPHQLFPGRSLWAHSDFGAPSSDHAPAKCPAPQRAQHLTAAPVCPGAAPTLLPGHSTEDTHLVCPARGTTQKTPTLPLLLSGLLWDVLWGCTLRAGLRTPGSSLC